MKNYSKVVEKMKSKQLTLKQLKLTMEDINYLRDNGHNVKEQYDPRVEDYVYYIVTSGDTAYIKISDPLKQGQEVNLKLLEISDLHCGCRNFDKQGLDRTLQEAQARGVEFVHISGDLIDGFGVYRGQENNLKHNKAIEQINELMAVLEKYDFWYIASMGNHDQSFCMKGGLDPIKYLEAKMAKKGKRFTYLSAYEANIIHAGIVFRLIHLSGGAARAASYKVQVYLSRVFESNLNDVEIGGKIYNLRSIQAGHFHTFYSLSMSGIRIIMPGNFQHDGDLEKRMGISGKTGGIFTELTIIGDKIAREKIEFFDPLERKEG